MSEAITSVDKARQRVTFEDQPLGLILGKKYRQVAPKRHYFMPHRDIIVVGASAGGVGGVAPLEERVELQRRMAQRSQKDNHHLTSRQFRAKASENARHARLVRGVLDRL